MKKITFMQNKKSAAVFFAALVLLFTLFFSVLYPFKRGENAPVTASASTSDSIAINRYDVDVTIGKDRTVRVEEKITVRFLEGGLTMFYKSLPLERDTYSDITAKCAGNADFYYQVADNPDVDGFLDINCIGGAKKGNEWTYELGYTMVVGVDDVKNGMILDVVGGGTAVPLNNVTVTVHFPTAPVAYKTYAGGYGTKTTFEDLGGVQTLSEDGKTLTMSIDRLKVTYNDEFGERMAQAVTLRFELEKGVLKSHFAATTFTKTMFWMCIFGVLSVVAAVFIRVKTRKDREIVTVVNVKVPDGLDPMAVGKILDGTVDAEDTTSMIYYFAAKGYLAVEQTEDDEIILHKKRGMDGDEPPHQKTLFNGLFVSGDDVTVSSLANSYYVHADTAKLQVGALDTPHIDKRSMVGAALCFLLSLALATLVPLFAGLIRIGGSYLHFNGVFYGVAVAASFLLSYVSWNYQFKWKTSQKRLIAGIRIAVILIASAIYVAFIAGHILTTAEKIAVMLFAVACSWIGERNYSRLEKYNERLGQILGFKNFILYTEEDKIEYMLKEEPELFYDILPYAQVLGVTDEWEKKFEKILISPPNWYVGTGNLSFFDYYVLHRCLTRSATMMMSRPSGNSVGRSGGGGGFGGFSGGGHGGGGFGAR